MSTSCIVDAFLRQMHQEGLRLSVRSITRRLADAGLRVQVWRRARRAEVSRACEESAVVIPNRSLMAIGAGTDTRWDVVSLKSAHSHKLERLRMELLLLDWKPKGTVILCTL